MKRWSLIFLMAVNLSGCCTTDLVSELERNTSQNITYYVKENRIVSAETQKKLSKNFLAHFFLPWAPEKFLASAEKIKENQSLAIQAYQTKKLIGANTRELSPDWLARIICNMNWATFPNLKMRAITVQDANVRLLPTIEPAFESWSKPGKGYPFDVFQQSFIAANTPIFVWHISRDGAWYFIMADSYAGWISRKDIAFVNQKFVNTWKKHCHVAAVEDNVSSFDRGVNFAGKVRVGSILPSVGKTKAYYKVLVATRNDQHYAQPKQVNLSVLYATPFPMLISTQNAANLAQKLISHPYGWGGMYGYRDCSSTLKDLFAPFGIWLPRNSMDQLKASAFIDLSKMTRQEKAKTISEQGIPFFTVLHLPGHILLYLGNTQQDIFVMHDMWGLRTKNIFGQEGRRVVGQTVITPINFGARYFDVKKTYLDTIDGMRSIIPDTLHY